VTEKMPQRLERMMSVIICTRNRGELLRLTSVVNQEFPRTDYAVVVFDNGSTDSAPEVVAEFPGHANVRYIRKERVGFCIARNTGWRAASGHYVVFDAIASPGWLKAIRDGFDPASPTVGVIGGCVRPIWEPLTIIDWESSIKFIDDISREWLVGANMAVPKALLAEVDRFHPWLDRVGNNLFSSGDVFLQKELMRRGYRCLYPPTMEIKHRVSDAVIHLIEMAPSPTQGVRRALVCGADILRSRRRIASLPFRANCAAAIAAKCLSVLQVGFISSLLGAARR
jgi:glycosyltransferase involved in cell wall biosynthesis